MFNNPSPLIYSNGNYRYGENRSQWMNQNPQEVELMMKQKFQQPLNQNNMQIPNYQTDPYLELQNELMNCSVTVRNKILSDSEYQLCDNECELLLKQAIEEVFEQLYVEQNEGFLNLIESYAEKRGDNNVQDIILGIYNFSMASPNPKEWLEKST